MFKNLLFVLLLLVGTSVLISCTGSEVANANTSPSVPNTNTDTANLQPAPVLPKNTDTKLPTKKYGALTADPEQLQASFEVKGRTKSDIYEVAYTSKETGKPEVLIVILVREGEVGAVFMRLEPISKAVFLVQKDSATSDKAALTSNGTVMITKDVNVARCIKGAQKVVGVYESTVKQPSESTLVKFWLNDCGNLPTNFLAPIEKVDMESQMDKLNI